MKPLVIKLGSALLSDPDGCFDGTILDPLAATVSNRWKVGQPTLVVSSGAVALGRSAFSIKRGLWFESRHQRPSGRHN